MGTAVELGNPGNGRIFCVLPMPMETASNLPVHVNGTFGINDDRRSLKWPGVERKNDPMADWNTSLLKNVIPSCYIDLLLEATSIQVMSSTKPGLTFGVLNAHTGSLFWDLCLILSGSEK